MRLANDSWRQNNCFVGRREERLLKLNLSPLLVGADFQEGDGDSNSSIFRVRRLTEWPGHLHWIAFPAEILTKPSFTELPPPFSLKNPFFHWKVLRRIPFPKIGFYGWVLIGCDLALDELSVCNIRQDTFWRETASSSCMMLCTPKVRNISCKQRWKCL